MELVFEGVEFAREDGKVFSFEDMLELHADNPEVIEVLTQMQNEVQNLKKQLSEDK